MPASPNEKLRKWYKCKTCGFSPKSSAGWCDLGCGSDYNTMIELSDDEVRAIENLFSTSLNATLQSLVDEGPKENSEEFWHMSHFVHDIGCIPELERQAEINGSNTAIAAYRRLIESKMKSDTKLIESKKGKADPIS